MSERTGDAVKTTLPAVPRGGPPYITVLAHDDGGVTICHFDREGRETARMSFMRETWVAIVEAARGGDA